MPKCFLFQKYIIGNCTSPSQVHNKGVLEFYIFHIMPKPPRPKDLLRTSKLKIVWFHLFCIFQFRDILLCSYFQLCVLQSLQQNFHSEILVICLLLLTLLQFWQQNCTNELANQRQLLETFFLSKYPFPVFWVRFLCIRLQPRLENTLVVGIRSHDTFPLKCLLQNN